MPSTNVYAFNTGTAPVSPHDDDDADDDNDDDSPHEQLPSNADGLFNSHNSGGGGGSGNAVHRRKQEQHSRCCTTGRKGTTILVSIIVFLFVMNITLLSNRIRNNNMNKNIASNSDTGTTNQPKQRVSPLLYNAIIPIWKPLPSPDTLMTNIAFGSCASQNIPQTFWDTMSQQQQQDQLEHRPDLFIYMGDNVYGDCSTEACDELRMAYYNLSLHPTIQGIQIPILATLDDHDYGLNNCDMNNPYKDTAKELFQEFFSPQYTSDKLPWHDGVYQGYVYGPSDDRTVQILLLDTRYGRSPFQETGNFSSPYRPKEVDDIDQGNMLSEFQWKWLSEQIKTHPNVAVRIIISSIQVLNDVTGFEAWRHLPMEQARLVQLLQNEKVIFLSGDRHVGGIYEQVVSTGSTGKKLVEITASSLTHSIPLGMFNNCRTADECDEDAGTTRVSGSLIRDNHYGTLEIDWEQNEVTIALRRAENSNHNSLQGDAGDVLTSKTYLLSEL